MNLFLNCGPSSQQGLSCGAQVYWYYQERETGWTERQAKNTPPSSTTSKGTVWSSKWMENRGCNVYIVWWPRTSNFIFGEVPVTLEATVLVENAFLYLPRNFVLMAGVSSLSDINKKLTPRLLVLKRNTPTKLPPLVGEVNAVYCG